MLPTAACGATWQDLSGCRCKHRDSYNPRADASTFSPAPKTQGPEICGGVTMRGIKFCYVAATLIAMLGLAYRAPAQGTAAPVAFVYVASSPSEDPNASYVINAFTADASGRLTR